MWNKKGLIFQTDHNYDWMRTHACVPTAILVEPEVIRVYFAPRNAKGQSLPTFVDVDANDPSKVIRLHDKPVLQLGELGTFDDGGIMPCCALRHNDEIYLYYVGWNPTVSVAYRNAVGLAISKDNGLTFERVYQGPIVGRNMTEPFFTASPYAMKEADGKWHLWYASSTGFVVVNDKPEPLYEIKYAHSKDGIHWERDNHTAVPPVNRYECTARPAVIKENGIFKMWYTYRGSFDYRDGKDSYRIGYAESKDAVNWERKDEVCGIGLSESGWDDKMQTYPDVLQYKDKKYLFYNGNGFGLSGLGYAEWQD